MGLLPQMQHSFWEAGREHGCVPVNLEVGTQKERGNYTIMYMKIFTLYSA